MLLILKNIKITMNRSGVTGCGALVNVLVVNKNISSRAWKYKQKFA